MCISTAQLSWLLVQRTQRASWPLIAVPQSWQHPEFQETQDLSFLKTHTHTICIHVQAVCKSCVREHLCESMVLLQQSLNNHDTLAAAEACAEFWHW